MSEQTEIILGETQTEQDTRLALTDDVRAALNVCWQLAESLPDEQRAAVNGILIAGYNSMIQLNELVSRMNEQLTRAGAFVDAAAASNKLLVEQRDHIADELAKLANAIEHTITYHPRLEKLVEDIREEIQDATLDYADEQQQLRAADFLHQELELPYPVAKAYAGEIIELLYNDTAPTGEQREALQALCDTLELPYWIGKATDDDDEPAE